MSPHITLFVNHTKPRHRAGLGSFWATPQRTYHPCVFLKDIFIEESVMCTESAFNDQDLKQRVNSDDFLMALFTPFKIYAKDHALLNALPDQYPRLFPDGELTWGFQISPGWSNLIALLCARIDVILQSDPEARLHVKQVKEKFGRLRFYYEMEGESESLRGAIRQAVELAENASGICCENCGERAGTSSNRGWLRTLCLRCSASEIE